MAAPQDSCGDLRDDVEQMVRQLPGGIDGERTFDQPWELRVFALAVALQGQGHFAWPEFQSALIHSIQREEGADIDEQASYYEHWIRALEAVLEHHDMLDASSLDDHMHSVLATPRNANHHRATRHPVGVSPAVIA